MLSNKSIRAAGGTVEIKVEKSIEDVPQAAWDELSVGHPFAQTCWLRLLELTLADYEPRYVMVWQGDKLVAGAVCHLQRKFHLSIYLKSKILAAPASRFLHLFPPLTCTLPIFNFPGVLLDASLEKSEGMALLHEAIYGVARQERSVFTGYSDLDPETGKQVLAPGSLIEMSLPPDSLLAIEWDSYEAYEAFLPKKKRAEIRRVRNRAREYGVTVKADRLRPDYEARIEQLIGSVAERHGNRYLYKPNLVHNALQVLKPDDYRFVMVCHQDDIIGHVLLMCSNGVMVVKWIGLDYPRTEPTLAYHYLMTETVYHAIEMNVQQLALGVTTYTLKKKMGAVLEPRLAAIQLRPKPINSMFNRFLAKKQNHDGFNSD